MILMLCTQFLGIQSTIPYAFSDTFSTCSNMNYKIYPQISLLQKDKKEKFTQFPSRRKQEMLYWRIRKWHCLLQLFIFCLNRRKQKKPTGNIINHRGCRESEALKEINIDRQLVLEKLVGLHIAKCPGFPSDVLQQMAIQIMDALVAIFQSWIVSNALLLFKKGGRPDKGTIDQFA